MKEQHPKLALFDTDALRLTLALHRLVRSVRRVVPPSSGLTPAHLVTLSVLLEHGPSRIGQIAQLVPCSQPTATTLVGQLEREGLVCKEPDPNDGRAVQITITAVGRDQMVSLACGEAELLGARLDSLSTVEQKLVHEMIPVLRKLSEDH